MIAIGERKTIPSKILDRDIQLSVHLPDGYEESKERCPVLFTFQTHFEQVCGAVKNLYDYGLVPRTIVVRVDNYEFGYLTPTAVESDPNSGRADQFLRFFREELFPYVDGEYRTHPYRIVFSNSWGAMFAVYAILAQPDVFNAAIASIPWVTYDDDERYMINNAARFLAENEFRNFLFMTMDNESEILHDLKTFVEIFKRYPEEGLDWEYHYWPEEDHTSTPYRSIHSGLRALYRGWNAIPVEVVFRGLEQIKKHESSMNKKFGYPIGVSPNALRLAGQAMKTDQRFDEAIAIYKYAVEKRPDDAFAYVTLGRAYEESSQLELAKGAYEKAYEIALAASHPQVKWIRNFLDRIKQRIVQAKD